MLRVLLVTFFIGPFASFVAAEDARDSLAERVVEADLLVVGGTESGCAAAVQAARMGVERIVLVNDIEWLGGQFSAEGLGAIDENRAHGYDGSVPIPRSGLFKEVIDGIETRNAELYGGVKRPGNTRVITTSRPVVSEAVFRELLAPHERSGRIGRFSNYRVGTVHVADDRVTGVSFISAEDERPMRVNARLTIDASDWGDVVKGSGAAWDAGLDAKADFDEPSAPTSGEPATDMNPITWCMILVQQDDLVEFDEPAGYDPRYFTGKWGWIDEKFAYTSRRLVDGAGFEEIDHPDVLLINSPPIDYPLDVYPADVAAALEADEPGASKRNLVAMTPVQREIVFADARRHSLKYLHHLRTRFPKFRRMALSDEFGTPDRLPPKPYVRESLRLVSQHVVREQEVLGFGGRSNYANCMFPDAVFSWQFELDFHPTKRSWTTDAGDAGPWEADFRGNRRFGRGGTGRCVFPVRGLVPEKVRGLIGAQKNLGYTSIVGSSCRLHDQSMHAGQAAGAVASVCLRNKVEPATLFLDRRRLAEVWTGLVSPPTGVPLAIWPFADVEPDDPDFAAIQQLAFRRLLPLDATDTSFAPDEPAKSEWRQVLIDLVGKAGYELDSAPDGTESRRDVARRVWSEISEQPIAPWKRIKPNDADGDGIVDVDDPLPFTKGTVSWKVDPKTDGVPDDLVSLGKSGRAFDFTAADGPALRGFTKDIGAAFQEDVGHGWRRDLSKSTRLRLVARGTPRDGFVFTRTEDTWECEVENGRWHVAVCLGDAAHEQPGQHLSVEGRVFADGVDTAAGQYLELAGDVTVRDGRLTVVLGGLEGGSNTCLNWLLLKSVE